MYFITHPPPPELYTPSLHDALPISLGVSTPAAYRAWDDLGGPLAEGPNDLEPAALRVEPRLARWRDRIGDATGARPVDRKSTRLNSSHMSISYAVFCLKKKKNIKSR